MIDKEYLLHRFGCHCIIWGRRLSHKQTERQGEDMIKVLLVDDEKLALEYIENIIDWKIYGFELVGVMSDAQQALKVFRKKRPDLIISDICMYGMDGLDFAAAIREIDQNVHILFLSGYKNFDYIQEAIRLGIDDYLLKSDIDEEVFLSKILKLKEKIEKEHQKQRYTQKAIFKELFLKNKEEKEYKEILSDTDYISLHKKYHYLILARRRIPKFMEEFLPGIGSEEYNDEELIYRIVNKGIENFRVEKFVLFPINEYEILVVMKMESNFVSQKEIYEQIYRLTCGIFKEINKATDNEYNVLFYSKACAIRQFGLFYRENREQMNQFYVKKEVQIAELELISDYENETGISENITSGQVAEMIRNNREDEIEGMIESIMIALEQEDYVTYLWYTKEMMLAFRRLEESVTSSRGALGFDIAEGAGNYNLRNPYEVIKYLSYKLEELSEIYGEKKGISYSQPITKAMEIVEENYGDEELSANIIAKQVGLSNSYFSTKFKEEVGTGITDYINTVRIQHAKKMLDEETYMIYEVAEKTGFGSSQYFSKIFKQITGLTPNEYKRKKQK